MAYRGKSLRALRESKQIQLRRISYETRIGIAYLKDLEEERFDRFPGKFYFKSFTKEYARSLGLDPSEVVNDLEVAYEEWSGERPARQEEPSDSPVEEGIWNRITGYLRGAQEV